MLVSFSILFALAAVEAVVRLTHYKDYLLRSQFYGYPEFYFRADEHSGFDISENFPAQKLHFADGDTLIWSNEMGCFDDPYQNEEDYILLVGDSFTWGYAPFEAKFGTIVEKYSGHRVLKCGVTGYGSKPELIKIRKVAARTGKPPSLLIVGYCIGNDLKDDYLFPHITFQDGFLLTKAIIGNISNGEKRVYSEAELNDQLDNWKNFGMSRQPTHPYLQKLHWWFKQKFLFYNIVAEQELFRNLLLRMESGGDTDTAEKEREVFNQVMPYISLDAYPWVKNAWNGHLSTLKDISEFAEGSGTKVLFVLIPMKEQVYDALRVPGDYSWEQPNEIVKGYFRKHSIAFIDLLPLFRDFVKKTGGRKTGHEQDLYWRNDAHWNIKGNRLAGLLVTKYLIENNLLEVADRQKANTRIVNDIHTLATEGE